MEKIEIKSGGSYSRETHIGSGYNPYSRSALAALGEALAAVESSLSAVNDSIGFDINNPAAARQISRMPEARKKSLRARLLTLKKLARDREVLKERESILSEQIYQRDQYKIAICFRAALIPVVRIQLLDRIKDIREKDSRLCYRLDEGEIRRFPL